MTDDEMTPPPEAWDPKIPAEIVEVLNATFAVVRDTGDHGDLVDRLVADHGEAKALWMLAFIQVRATQLSFARTKTMLTVERLPGWENRRCPTCGAVCDECLAHAERDLRDALGDLGGGSEP